MLDNSFTDSDIARDIGRIKKEYLDFPPIENAPSDRAAFLEWVWNESSSCQDCLLCESRTIVVRGDGQIDAPIMIVGEGPGFIEDRTGWPLCGPPELKTSRCSVCKNSRRCFRHKLMNSPTQFLKRQPDILCEPNMTQESTLPEEFYLRSAGAIFDGILVAKWGMRFPRDNWVRYHRMVFPESEFPIESPFFITNTVLCRSYDSARSQDVSPSTLFREKCKRWLTYQWAAVRPKVILALGKPALDTIMGKESVAKNFLGKVTESPYGPLIFQYHPAFFMRERTSIERGLGYAKIGKTIEDTLKFVGLL